MEKQYINPPGVFPHPHYTGVITVSDPPKFHFIAGQCAADPEDYACVAPGDFVAQYREVMRILDSEVVAQYLDPAKREDPPEHSHRRHAVV